MIAIHVVGMDVWPGDFQAISGWCAGGRPNGRDRLLHLTGLLARLRVSGKPDWESGAQAKPLLRVVGHG
jgi:hypothetical protein